MKKISLLSSLMIVLLFSGCADYVKKLADSMQKMNQEKALAGTEDKVMVNTFIKNVPKAYVARNQIYTYKKLDLGNKAGSQTTNLNSWIYRPTEFFERNADKITLSYKTWSTTVKQRGNTINKYNARIANKLGANVYLNRLQSYEKYYNTLVPSYIEIDNNGNMISAFMKILKTEDLSAVGGYVVEGHHSYYAYEYDVVLLRTTLRKLQMNNSKRFFEDNILESNINIQTTVQQNKKSEIAVNNPTQANININQIMVDKYNAQNKTNFKSMQEIQNHLSTH